MIFPGGGPGKAASVFSRFAPVRGSRNAQELRRAQPKLNSASIPFSTRNATAGMECTVSVAPSRESFSGAAAICPGGNMTVRMAVIQAAHLAVNTAQSGGAIGAAGRIVNSHSPLNGILLFIGKIG